MDKVIPEVMLKRLDDVQKPFKHAGKDVGFRNKIGGKPTGISKDEYPKCPECKKVMTFYGQLDSLNEEICIADCGVIAVFICFDCYTTKSEVFSY